MTAEIRSFFESHGKGGYEGADFEERGFIGQDGDFALAGLCWTIGSHEENKPCGFARAATLAETIASGRF
jgi:hypothetical protein